MFRGFDELVAQYTAIKGVTPAQRDARTALAARINAIYDIRVQIHNFWLMPQMWHNKQFHNDNVPRIYQAPQSFIPE